MFDKILPYLLAGVSVGGQYALIAVGYTMVYGILRADQLRPRRHIHRGGLLHGLSSPPRCRWPYRAAAGGHPHCGVLGFTVERVAYKPLRSAPRMSDHDLRHRRVSYLLQNLMWYVTGGLAKQYPVLPWLSDTVSHGRGRPPRWSRWSRRF